MPRFAANISLLFTEHPFMARFAAAAEAGFKAVEFLYPYNHDARDIAAQLEQHELRNVLFNMPPGNTEAGERGIAALPGREAEFRDSVALAIEYARIIGTPRLHVMAGITSPAGSRHSDRDHGTWLHQCRATFVQNLRHAARQCAPHGIEIMIEPINTRDMPGYFLNFQHEAHALRNDVAAPNLKIQMDFYHAQIMEGDIAATLRQHLAHIGHIQIAGVPERHEPDSGELNYPWLFSLLDELGYEGWVGCEYRPAGSTRDGLGWLNPQAGRATPA